MRPPRLPLLLLLLLILVPSLRLLARSGVCTDGGALCEAMRQPPAYLSARDGNCSRAKAPRTTAAACFSCRWGAGAEGRAVTAPVKGSSRRQPRPKYERGRAWHEADDAPARFSERARQRAAGWRGGRRWRGEGP